MLKNVYIEYMFKLISNPEYKDGSTQINKYLQHINRIKDKNCMTISVCRKGV
jgi:hypothetical protein